MQSFRLLNRLPSWGCREQAGFIPPLHSKNLKSDWFPAVLDTYHLSYKRALDMT